MNIKIQNKWREKEARNELRRRKQQNLESVASVKIASVFKTVKAKNSFKEARNATVALQCMARAIKARKVLFSERTKERLRLEACRRSAARTVQAGFRGVQGREKARKARLAREVRLATQMQSFLRACRQKREFIRYKSAVTVVQNKQRGKISR